MKNSNSSAANHASIALILNINQILLVDVSSRRYELTKRSSFPLPRLAVPVCCSMEVDMCLMFCRVHQIHLLECLTMENLSSHEAFPHPLITTDIVWSSLGQHGTAAHLLTTMCCTLQSLLAHITCISGFAQSCGLMRRDGCWIELTPSWHSTMTIQF
jgi:hypothetical protein